MMSYMLDHLELILHMSYMRSIILWLLKNNKMEEEMTPLFTYFMSLKEKHDAVAEKNTKLEEMMTPLSTSFLSVKVLAKCTCCMMNNAELSSFFFHCGTIPDFVT